MAWGNISIIYGVVITFQEFINLFPKTDWSFLEHLDDYSSDDIERSLNQSIHPPSYRYCYKYSRRSSQTGELHPTGFTSNWVHSYACCSELANTHVILGRVIGDVEPQQFLNLPNESYLPIWHTVLTVDKLSELAGVSVFPTDYNLTSLEEHQVNQFLKDLNISQQPQLLVSADDCYSCT